MQSLECRAELALGSGISPLEAFEEGLRPLNYLRLLNAWIAASAVKNNAATTTLHTT